MKPTKRSCFQLVAVLLSVVPLPGDKTRPKPTANPRIVSVKELPPEPVQPGTCTVSRSGYLEVVGEARSELTEQEIGQYILSRLREGYTVTLYPSTKHGIFAMAECNPQKH